MGFIDSIKAKAIEIYYRTGILPSLSISQAILESGWGKSGLTQNANNLFGYKGEGTAGSVVMASPEFDAKTGTWSVSDSAFRAYNSIDESFDDYAKLISTSSNYKEVVKATDWKSAVSALDASPYATDPSYGAKLSDIIVKNQLFKIDEEAVANESSWGGITGGTGTWSTGTQYSTTGTTRSWGENIGEGMSGFFNLNADEWLETAGEWFKSFAFILVGLLLLGLGIWFMFGAGGTVVQITKEVLDNG